MRLGHAVHGDQLDQGGHVQPGRAGRRAPVILGAKLGLGQVRCPASTQCTAVESDGGGEVTFNPQAPAADTPVTIDNEEFNVLFDLACPVGHPVHDHEPGRPDDHLQPPDR